MDYQEIMRDIASGLTGDKEKDLQYLMEQMEKYKDHELGKEIIRACGRLISGMLPEEKVNEFADAFEKDNAEIENELDDLFSTIQSGDYNLALDKVEKLVEKAEELISAGMYQNDSVSDYFVSLTLCKNYFMVIDTEIVRKILDHLIFHLLQYISFMEIYCLN